MVSDIFFTVSSLINLKFYYNVNRLLDLSFMVFGILRLLC